MSTAPKQDDLLSELLGRDAFARCENTTDPFSDRDSLRELLTSLEKEGRKDLAELVGWEIQARELLLQRWRANGRSHHALRPLSEGPDGQGGTVVYPDIKGFPTEMLKHLRTRIDQAENPVLKARFADILWIRGKDHKAADTAIEAYAGSAVVFLDKEEYLEFTDYFGRATSIAIEANSLSWGQKLIESAKSHLVTLEEKKEYRWVMEVLFELLGFPKEWMDRHYEFVLETAERGYQWSNPEHPTLDLSFAHYLKIKELAYRQKGDHRSARECRFEEARCFERLALDAMRSNQFMKASTHFHTCLQKYISLGQRSDKVDEMKRLLKECNQKARLHEFQTTTTEVEVPREEIDRLLDSLKEKPVEEVLGFVASEQTFLCSIQDAEEQAKLGIEAAPLLHLVSGTVQGPRGNIIEVLDTGEKKLKHALYEVLSFHYEFTARHFLIPILDLVRARAHTTSFWGVLEECFRYSLYNLRRYGRLRKLRLHTATPCQPRKRQYVASRLAGFFAEFDFFVGDDILFLQNGFERFLDEDYVGSVHVLIFRIEEILRRVLERLDVATSSVRNGKTEEKALQRILEEPKLRSALGEDIAVFLEWLLIAKLGLNLRHNVAHGLLKYPSFSKRENALVIYALLLFTRFSFVQESDRQGQRRNPSL